MNRHCLSSYGVTESYDLQEGVYEREILPIAPLLHGVKEAFADPDTGMAPAIMEIDPEQIDDYYSVCEARFTSLMAMEQPDISRHLENRLRQTDCSGALGMLKLKFTGKTRKANHRDFRNEGRDYHMHNKNFKV